MICKYRIEDIQHAKLPKRGQSKIGTKYDNRRGKEVTIDMGFLKIGSPVIIEMGNGKVLNTTPFERLIVEHEMTTLETINSIYKLVPIRDK